MDKLIAIVGPTAVGKTKISIDLAKMLETEIISGDSMLIYKGMNIGTAKPTIEERRGVKHHLVDIIEPHEEFSVAQFQKLAAEHIAAINKNGKIPILAGGTGLYVKALLEGYNFNTVPANEALRSRLAKISGSRGSGHLHKILHRLSPQAAALYHPNDTKRVIRALEVYYTTGSHVTAFGDAKAGELVYDAMVIGLTMERSLLYERINKRVDIMISRGLVEEVLELINSGVTADMQSMQGIGYKEICEYLKGRIDFTTAVNKIKQNTRHFAKRQITWYKKMPYVIWFDVNNSAYDNILADIYKEIAGKFNLR